MRLPHDIGVSTDPWDALPLAAALDRAAQYADLVEIGSYGEHRLIERRNRRTARSSGLRLTVHGPYWGMDIGSPDERRRRQAVETHRRHLEGAAETGALCYVVHPDFSPDRRRGGGATLSALTRSLQELSRLQRHSPTRIVIENMPGRDRSHFIAPTDVPLGDLGLVLDAGHAAIAGVLSECLTDPPAGLVHVHLHDNHGDGDVADPHLPLGDGSLPVPAVVAAARRADATMVLEMLDETSVRRSVAHLDRLGLLDETAADPCVVG